MLSSHALFAESESILTAEDQDDAEDDEGADPKFGARAPILTLGDVLEKAHEHILKSLEEAHFDCCIGCCGRVFRGCGLGLHFCNVFTIKFATLR